MKRVATGEVLGRQGQPECRKAPAGLLCEPGRQHSRASGAYNSGRRSSKVSGRAATRWLEEPGLEIHYRRDIPGAHVADTDTWSPGHPKYDRLPSLLR